MNRKKGMFLLISAVLCGVISLVGALDAFSGMRPVIIITVFGGAFGSGAALVSAIYDFKKARPDSEDALFAVIRETHYDPDQPVEKTEAFQEFQALHAERPRYKGSVVTHIGDGRYMTLTLWQTADDMHAARKALEPVVKQLLNPIMTKTSKLHGTGPVIFNDLDLA